MTDLRQDNKPPHSSYNVDETYANQQNRSEYDLNNEAVSSDENSNTCIVKVLQGGESDTPKQYSFMSESEMQQSRPFFPDNLSACSSIIGVNVVGISGDMVSMSALSSQIGKNSR